MQVTFHYISVRAVLYSESTYVYMWLILNLFFLILNVQAPVSVLKSGYCQKLAPRVAQILTDWSYNGLRQCKHETMQLCYWYLKIRTMCVSGSEQFKDAVWKNDFIINAYQMGPQTLQFCYKFTCKWISTLCITQTSKHLIFVFSDPLLAIPVLFPAWKRMLLACFACCPCCHCLRSGGGQELHLKCT